MVRKNTSDSDDLLLDLEQRLAGTLQPIRPSRAVVVRLRERLHFPDRAVIQLRLPDWQRMFFVFGGVMSGMLVIITIARALFHLVGRKHF